MQTPAGEAYKTTRRAKEVAQDRNLERSAKMLAGIGVASGAGYKILSGSPTGRIMSPLLLYGTARAVDRLHRPLRIPNFEGSDTPINTEVQKVGADKFSDASIYAMLAQEYHRNKVACTSIKDLAKPYLTTVKTAQHPAIRFLASVAVANPETEKLAQEIMSKFITPSRDSVELGDLDLIAFGHWLGEGLIS